MGAKRTRSRPNEQPPSGQHLLRSGTLAAELVADAAIGPEDVVLEIGAGKGRLTSVLARVARNVVAVELDARFATVLRRRFVGVAAVDVVNEDILDVPFPNVPFRAFGNVPFGITTAILRRLLDDPTSQLVGADLILQYDAARKRASTWPSNLLSLGWLPWWEFRVVRHLHASAFEPPPSVDAGVLSIRRRLPPLLPANARSEYRSFVGRAFRRADLPVHRSVRGSVPSGVVRRSLRDRGLPPWSKPSALDVFDWVALFSTARDGGR